MNRNKKLVIAAVIAVVLVTTGVYAATRSTEPEAQPPQSTTEQSEQKSEVSQEKTQEPAPATTSAPVASSPGAYTNYNAASFAKLSGKRVLFFHAPWCPQCRSLDASIKAGKVPDNTTIVKVDYDSNQALRQKYGVTIQTTLVLVDSSGNLDKKYVAYDQPTLQAVIDNLL
jgi:thiol-disulfide isomerase/thioredoxin